MRHATDSASAIDPSRRRFLQQSAAALLATGAIGKLAPSAWSGTSGLGDREIRIALIGCGGRGTGAAAQALSTSGKVRLVAMADAFQDRLDESLRTLQSQLGDRVDVPAARRFVGFDAYKAAIEGDVDVVVIATPPGFRPIHFEHAVAHDRHVFMEKPVAVDGPGVRRVLAAAEASKQKNLKVGVGLQRHHDPHYLETVKQIRDGAIGDVVLMRVYWNGSGVWVRPRQPGWTEMEYQMRNWYYFNWLCGDHIVEQHIHNLDVGNWVKGATPVSAQGQGGRQVRNGIDHGEIYDHHMVEYTYADGSKMLSQCRHIPGCFESVSEHAHGTKGTADVSGARVQATGSSPWRSTAEGADAYQVEHDVLFAAVRNDTPHNEAENGAHASLTAILGRMATYSGQLVTWDQALNSKIDLAPAVYDWKANPRSMPGADGRYAIAMPGNSQAF